MAAGGLSIKQAGDRFLGIVATHDSLHLTRLEAGILAADRVPYLQASM